MFGFAYITTAPRVGTPAPRVQSESPNAVRVHGGDPYDLSKTNHLSRAGIDAQSSGPPVYHQLASDGEGDDFVLLQDSDSDMEPLVQVGVRVCIRSVCVRASVRV